MRGRHEFRYANPPRGTEYLLVVGASALALGLTALAIVGTLDPEQQVENALDNYGLWFIAAAAWAAPLVLGLSTWRRIKAFRDKKPAVAVDENGITLRSWTGTAIDLKWTEVSELDFDHRPGAACLRIRAGTISGETSLEGLTERPSVVWDAIRRCREAR